MRESEIIVDSFAGGGGASIGIAAALGRSPDIAINHDADALAMHAANHPETRHVREDVWHARLRDLVDGRPVGLLWASPDCKHFSRAKGSKPVEKSIRSLAWVVVRWASQIRPRVIILENVREFADWGPVVPQWQCRCGWKGTEGQANLARTRRRCPRCNSLRIKETERFIPDPDRKGCTFRLFCNRLRGYGYRVEFRNLNASDFGAPTHRRRLFLVARCDDAPIVWPEPTHGDPAKLDDQPLFDRLQPWRTAAECIDWSLPCPSIFGRPKPLAEKTQRRIALGMQRYVLEADQPFLVPLTHSGERRCRGVDEPLPTVTTARRGEHAVVTPYIAQLAHGDGKTGTFANSRRGRGVDEPLGTIHAGGGNHAVVAPTLIQTGYSEREGQAPRVPGLDKPLGTVVAGGAKHALVSAFIAKHYGGVVGVPATAPLGTVTARDGQGLAAAYLARFNHGAKQWNAVDEPLGTVTSQGNKFGLVYAFLVKYFGTAIGQSCSTPLHTVTAKQRFGVVMVEVAPGDSQPAVAVYVPGVGPCIIVDIGMRMLQPHELAAAQGFPADYVLTGTKTSQVARIGNSVPPAFAEALVRANCLQEAAVA